MVNNGIRNIGIRNSHQSYGNEYKEKGNVKEKGSKIPCIVNDRKVMGVLAKSQQKSKVSTQFLVL